MTLHLFPADRIAFQFEGPGRPIIVPEVTPFAIYLDAECTTAATVYGLDGQVVEDGMVRTDATGLLEEFQVDEAVRVWALAQVPGADPYPLDAAFGPRITELEGQQSGAAIQHAALLGLDGDDHPHYLNAARGDLRYPTIASVTAGLAAKASNTALNAETTARIDADNAFTSALSGKAPTVHTHTSAGITDFVEAVQDVMGTSLIGSGVTVTYDDAGTGRVTITSAGSVDLEAVRDAIGVALVGVGNVSVFVDDAGDTITISTSATANSTDAALRDRETHTGTQAISTILGLQAALDSKQGTGSYAPALGPDDNYVTDAEKASLHDHANQAALDQVSGTNTGDQVLPTWGTISGKPAVVAAGPDASTARAAIGAGTSDLTLGTTGGTAAAGNDPRLSDARPPTVHTHTASEVVDFVEAAQDAIASLLAGASGVTLSYDDVANSLTISGGGAGGLDAEAVRDAIGVALVGTGNISVLVNDAADTITITTTATVNSTDAALRDRSTHTGTQAISTVDGLQGALDAKGTSNFSGAYSDLSGKPTLGTAAAAAVADFATATQGAKADTALQPTTGKVINAVTGAAYTLAAADAGKIVTRNNVGASTLSVLNNVFTPGQVTEVVNLGAGAVAFSPGVGVTFYPAAPVALAQYESVSVVCITPSTFVIDRDAAGGGGATPRWSQAFSDSRSALTVGAGDMKWVNATGRTLTIVAVRADVTTAPTGASLIVDVNKNGTTIFTTQTNRPTIAAAATSDVADAINVASVADGDYLTVDIDQIGSTVAGGKLTVTIAFEG